MAEPKRINQARALRRNDVPAEDRLWSALRNRALAGLKFRRQHPIANFIVDFACVECKLIVEIDGQSHLDQKHRDADRTAALESLGWKVQRIWNTDVYENLNGVKEMLLIVCEQRLRELHL
ncbi:MAG: DUF559 domain-containing protein [Gemmataceae bacterium]|nr:DUF559 domain-containing protein [Gemmataceae bacterium]